VIRQQSIQALFDGSSPRGALSRLPCSNGGACWFTRLSHALARLPAVLHLFLVAIIVLAIVFWVFLAVWIVVRLVRTAHQGEPLT
jgi:hypothetical protein